MQPSEQELVGIPDYYVWTGIRAELKASSHRVLTIKFDEVLREPLHYTRQTLKVPNEDIK